MARRDFFRAGVNAASLEAVDSAAFFLVLDETTPDYDPDDAAKLDELAKSCLHGNGYNRWFDKVRDGEGIGGERERNDYCFDDVRWGRDWGIERNDYWFDDARWGRDE